ncbi:MAG: hypothetical protein P8M73_07155 [Luminiphilus sp.]|jgi:hypothetical protein|nr:hypothetical protein [Luminiphilus sp.]
MAQHYKVISPTAWLIVVTPYIAAAFASINAEAQCVGDCAPIAQNAAAESLPSQGSAGKCDKVKKASGRYLHLSSQAMKKSHNAEEPQSKATSLKASMAFSQMAANTATV